MFGPFGPCCGFGMRHRHGWGWAWWWRPRFGWFFSPWHRSRKEFLRDYKRWLEEEMKFVDEALKEEKEEEQ